MDKKTQIIVEHTAALKIKAVSGNFYKIIAKNKNQPLSKQLLVIKRGEDLIISYVDGTEVIIEKFYAVENKNQTAVELDLDNEKTVTLTAVLVGKPIANNQEIIFLNGNKESLMSLAKGDQGVIGGIEQIAAAPSTSVGAHLAEKTSANSEDINWDTEDYLLWGGLGLSVIGGATVGLMGGGTNHSSTQNLAAAPIKLDVMVVAGPVFKELNYSLYDSDGKQITTGKTNKDGSVQLELSGDYKGKSMMVVISSNDPEADYKDEATGNNFNLAKPMRAMFVASKSSISLTVTPLTELAVKKIGVVDNVNKAPSDVALVNKTNEAIASAFGVKDILGGVKDIYSSSYNEKDGIDDAESYGLVLAKLSGIDKQTGSIDNTVNQLLSAVNKSDKTDLTKLVFNGGAILQQNENIQVKVNTQPTINDYLGIGVVRVTDNNLKAINNAVISRSLSFTTENITPEIQKIVDAYNRIINEANGPAPDADRSINPTTSDYKAIGAEIGAASSDNDNLNLLNDIIGGQTTSGVDTIAEINKLADIANKLQALAGQASSISSTELTSSDFSAMGLTGVTSGNLNDVLNQIKNADDSGSNTDSLSELQTLIDQLNSGLNHIIAYANDNGATSIAPVLSDYTSLGVSGISSSNLDAINSALASTPIVASNVDSRSEVQTIIDAYSKILSEANGAAIDATPADPTVRQYSAIGAQIGAASSDADNLKLLNDIIGAQTTSGVDTIAEINALAAIANNIQALVSQTSSISGNELNITDFSAIGLTGVTADNLNNVLDQIKNADDSGSNTDSLSELQTLIDQLNSGLNHIIAYANDNGATSIAPVLSDYTSLGVSGISSSNLDAIKSALASTPIVGSNVDSRSEVQAIIDAYSKILGEANGSSADANTQINPAASDYSAIGAQIGAASNDNDNLNLLNDIIGSKDQTQVDTIAQINALADIANKLQATVAGSSITPALTTDELNRIGLTGVDANNLTDVINKLKDADESGSNTDSLSKLQTLIDQLNRSRNIIAAYAGTSSTKPLLSDYNDLGATGVNSGNLDAIDDAIKHQTGVDAIDSTSDDSSAADSRSEVQAIIDAYSKILGEANGSSADANSNSNPSSRDYSAIGAQIGAASSDADNLNLLNDIIGGQTTSGVDTIAEINALAAIANNIQALVSQTSSISGNELNITDFSAIGLTGVTADNLNNVLNQIKNADDSGSNTDSLSELQTLIDQIAVQLANIAGGTGGFVINGECAGDESGRSVSSAGDVNGDGLADLIVGAWNRDPFGVINAGRSYVVFGQTGTTAINLSDIANLNGNLGFVINGWAANDQTGNSVSSVGDVNGDGLADLLVAVINSDLGTVTDAGRSYVVFGQTGTTAINLSNIATGNGGFVINGESANDYSGYSVSSAGDVNGDGLVDLIVGAHNALGAAPNSGRSYVVFGKTGTTAINLSNIAAANPIGGFVINGQSAADYSGVSVSSAGDVNGDGLADLIVGAYLSDPGVRTDAGRSYVVFGKTDTTAINLSDIASGSGSGFVINGGSASDQSGWSVSSAGDVNGDGLADLIVGAMLSDTEAGADAGRSYVVFGKTSTTAINLATIAAGTGGFVINGQCAGDSSGWSVSSAGDMNGDGLADLIVGASNSDPAAGMNAGRSYVVFGQTGTTAINLSAIAAGNGGFVINGQCAGDFSGFSVSSAGDVNGDGLADLIVGANFAIPGSALGAGRSYVIFGNTNGAFVNSSVDKMGTSGSDTLTSDGIGNQTLVGGAGDDTLTGNATNGADILYGGAGNDTFVLTSANTAALQAVMGAGGNSTQLSRVDGGSGIDTIRLTGGANLDLTAIKHIDAGGPDGLSRITSIEKIDLLTDGSANTLTLSDKDVIDMAGMNLFNTGNSWTNTTGTPLSATVRNHQLVVEGSANDTLNLSGNGWTITGLVSNSGNSYKVYQNTVSAAQLMVRTEIKVEGAIVNTAIQLSTIAAGTGGFVINGQAASDNSGLSVSSAGDVNGDGLADLIIGAIHSDVGTNTDAGRSYVVFGKMGMTAINLSTIAAGGAGAGGFVINGQCASDYTGCSVSSAGDVNGDGLADLIVAAETFDSNGLADNGRSYVVFGKTDTNAISVTALANNSGGFVINGECAYDWSGLSVSSAGDVNGDGLSDLIVGAPFKDHASNNFNENFGRSYVVFGKTGMTAINLSTIAAGGAGAGGFMIIGQNLSDNSGWSVSSAGDVNGDGLADLIVGAYLSDPGVRTDAGRSYVVFGQTGTTAIDLSAIAAGSGGFVINGQCASDQSGYSVSSAGDVNGDGLADLIVGAMLSDTGAGADAGRSYVVFGKTSTTAINLATIAAGTGGFVINGQCAGDSSGWSVSSAGDMNGDGLADLIVGAIYSDVGANANAGRSYVVFGQTGTTAINLSTIAAGSGGFVINGQCAADQSGYSVSSAGDVNGDGLADLIVGARYSDVGANANAGRSYVIFGSTDGAFSTSSVDQMGTSGNDTLTSLGNQTLVGGAGDDTFVCPPVTQMTSTSADILYGGAGNDVFSLRAPTITALTSSMGSGGNTTQLARIDGGSGFDTLLINSNNSLDLTLINQVGAGGPDGLSRITSIEKIDLATSTSTNILTLSAFDVIDVAGFNLIHSSTASADGKTWSGAALSATMKFHQLVVDVGAGTGDSVRLKSGDSFGTWTNSNTVSDGTTTYTVWQNQTKNVQVLVNSATQVSTISPVVLDLNHDGELVYSQIMLDVNGDGLKDKTAWAGAEDGVLVWDKYHDGLVHDNSQYAFSQYGGKTDLQGLAVKFDTNQDGVFNNLDSQFAEFRVWQDINQNGVSDAGEVLSLTELGLDSINLVSDAVQRTPAAGVIEAGRTTATASDGSQVLVADAAFEYQSPANAYGITTLQLNDGAALDLSELSKLSGLDSIGIVDLKTDHLANTLTLTLNDVLDMSGVNLFNSTNTSLVSGESLTFNHALQQLAVLGGAGDKLALDAANWAATSAVIDYKGHNLVVYDAVSASNYAQLFIEQTITVI